MSAFLSLRNEGLFSGVLFVMKRRGFISFGLQSISDIFGLSVSVMLSGVDLSGYIFYDLTYGEEVCFRKYDSEDGLVSFFEGYDFRFLNDYGFYDLNSRFGSVGLGDFVRLELSGDFESGSRGYSSCGYRLLFGRGNGLG